MTIPALTFWSWFECSARSVFPGVSLLLPSLLLALPFFSFFSHAPRKPLIGVICPEPFLTLDSSSHLLFMGLEQRTGPSVVKDTVDVPGKQAPLCLPNLCLLWGLFPWIWTLQASLLLLLKNGLCLGEGIFLPLLIPCPSFPLNSLTLLRSTIDEPSAIAVTDNCFYSTRHCFNIKKYKYFSCTCYTHTHRSAYLSVLSVCSVAEWPGEILAIMHVIEFPTNESFKT